MPWQRLIGRILTEEGATDRFRWWEVCYIVPRQAGKTLINLLRVIKEMLDRPGSSSLYTAQSGAAAREKMEHDWWPLVEGTVIHRETGLDFRRGHFARWRMDNGSLFRAPSMTKIAMRGITSVSLSVADEALADQDDTRELLLLPTMVTVDGAQIAISSTAGLSTSVWLRAKRDWGSENISDLGARRNFVEWSAPATSDYSDPDVWRAAHPALGYTISMETMTTLANTMSEDAFAREMLGVWVEDFQEAGILSSAWNMVQRGQAVPLGPVLTLSVDASSDHQRLVAVVSDGITVEVAAIREGAGDASSWLSQLLSRHPDIARVVMLEGGSVSQIGRDLELRGQRISWYRLSDFDRACARFYSAVLDRRLLVHRHPALDQAVGAATRRIFPSGNWRWWRPSEEAFISPLVAATLAYDGAIRRELEPKTPDPTVFSESRFSSDEEFEGMVEAFLES